MFVFGRRACACVCACCVLVVVQCHGPSMLPAINEEGDVILVDKTSRWSWLRKLKVGDVVIVQSPSEPGMVVCKRITALAGERVWMRTGVKRGDENKAALSVRREKKETGASGQQDYEAASASTDAAATESPRSPDAAVSDEARETQSEVEPAAARPEPQQESSDDASRNSSRVNDGSTSEVTPRDVHDYVKIPKGHVWLQGDNRMASVDSRAYGPVPVALVKGRVLLRVWPLREFGFIRGQAG